MPPLPPPSADEKEQLLLYLGQQRTGIRNAALGLSDDQARMTPTASALSIGGIVKHLNAVEDHWRRLALGEPRAPRDAAARRTAFELTADESLAEVLDEYDRVCTASDAAFRSLSLDAPVAVPNDARWFPKDVDEWSVRWVALHVIQETARHAGHADIIRESIDGQTMFELMKTAEGWADAH